MKFYRMVMVLYWMTTCVNSVMAQVNIGLMDDPAPTKVNGEFKKGSHVKLFLPYLPYIAISHSINAALVRPANNTKGWEYDLAVSHSHRDNQIFDFTLKRGVRFQDGSPFDADSILLNMEYFKKRPFTFTKLYQVFDRVEKIDDYKDVLDVLDLIKDRLAEAKRTLADINELKNDEDSELELWSSTLNEIEKKLEDIDRTLFEPE
ncbi:MAG: hypothetical protein COB67_04695, partial [SAR324 cluster bacterium]